MGWTDGRFAEIALVGACGVYARCITTGGNIGFIAEGTSFIGMGWTNGCFITGLTSEVAIVRICWLLCSREYGRASAGIRYQSLPEEPFLTQGGQYRHARNCGKGIVGWL
jgi:hypothetical protein